MKIYTIPILFIKEITAYSLYTFSCLVGIVGIATYEGKCEGHMIGIVWCGGGGLCPQIPKLSSLTD